MNQPDSTDWVQSGALYVVATPIGHLADLSSRAAGVLSSVDWIACEDTRASRPLLSRLGARARLLPAHRHNEAAATARIVNLLTEGQTLALISDAGTPAVSDPGARIVSAVLDAGFRAIPIPGPSALTALSSASGMVEGAFHFEGFLPSRASGRSARLQRLAKSECPVVLFEAPHRIADTLAAIESACGDSRWLCLGRELTKKFEEIHRCRAGEAAGWLAADPMRSRGEYALVIAPAGWLPPGTAAPVRESRENNAPDSDATGDTLTLGLTELLAALVPELGANRASRIVERLTHRPHRDIYRRAVLLANQLKDIDPSGSA